MEAGEVSIVMHRGEIYVKCAYRQELSECQANETSDTILVNEQTVTDDLDAEASELEELVSVSVSLDETSNDTE